MPRTVLDGEGDITGSFVTHPAYSEKLYELARIHDTYSTFAIVTGMKKQYFNTPGSLTDGFDAEVRSPEDHPRGQNSSRGLVTQKFQRISVPSRPGSLS